jgi:hypothetical protein
MEAFYMHTDTRNYGPRLREHEQNLAQIEKEREELEGEILRMQMQLLQLADEKVTCLQLHALTKKAAKLPLTEDEQKYLGTDLGRVISIPADAFRSMKLMEAAEAFLLRFGQPATHRQVLDGLRDGGLDVQLKNLDNSLRSAMQRSGKFKWFKDADGTYRWALLLWVNRSPRELTSQEPTEKTNLTLVEAEAMAKSA